MASSLSSDPNTSSHVVYLPLHDLTTKPHHLTGRSHHLTAKPHHLTAKLHHLRAKPSGNKLLLNKKLLISSLELPQVLESDISRTPSA